MSPPKQEKLIFLLGMARSGTKLLRDLLNNHEEIAILPIETQFMPHLFGKFKNRDLGESRIFDKFHAAFQETTYAMNARQSGLRLPAKSEWRSACRDFSFAEVMRQFFLISCAQFKPDAIYIGDKTPKYIGHVKLLKKLFPDAIFIHIYRDPRDRALSEYKVWRQNMRKSVRNWTVAIANLNQIIKQDPEAFIECRYEFLIQKPVDTLKNIVQRLGLEYQKGITSITGSTEKHGTAQNENVIIADNYAKFTDEISALKVRRLEEIAYPWLTHYGYSIRFAKRHKKLNPAVNVALAVYNRTRQLQFYCKTRGWLNGIKYFRAISR